MQNPVVSVVIVVYNSADTILKTLKSIEAQNNLDQVEVIVTDDASSDNTVEIVEKWKREKEILFDHIEVITVSNNTGVTANVIRGTNSAHGTYIRYIDGDDCLIPYTLIEAAKIAEKQKSDWVIGKVQIFTEDPLVSQSEVQQLQKLEDERYLRLRDGFEKVKKDIYFTGIYNTPAMGFYSRRVLDSIGGYDPKYKMMEDQPLVFKIIESGAVPVFYDKPVVSYRLRHSSISYTNESQVRLEYIRSMVDFFNDKQAPALLKSGRYLQWIKSNMYISDLKSSLPEDNKKFSLWRILRKIKTMNHML